jgi:hypothetical protein
MRKSVCLMLVVSIVAGAAAQDLWHDGSTRPSARDYAAEAGGALLGGALVGAGTAVVLGVAGFFVLFNPSGASGGEQGEGAFIGALVGAALGYPFGCGLGTTIAGRSKYADGNVGGAYTGAYIGCLLPLIGSPIGAVIGYNTGNSRETGPFGLHRRYSLELPAVALTSAELPDHSVEYGVKVQVAGLRF